MNKNLLVALGVFVAVVVAGFYLVKTSKITPKAKNQPANTSTIQDQQIKEVDISAKEFGFTPSTVSLKKGEKVRIKLINDGTTTHNLVVDGLNIQTNSIGPGESDLIDLTPTTDGTFSFFCNIGGHRGLGMEGQIVVQ